MRSFFGVVGLCVLVAACADGGSGGEGGSTSTAGGGTTTSQGGQGGVGGGQGGTTSQGGSGGMMMGTDPCTVDAVQLFVSEVVVQPAGGEFVEIWNPLGGEVDLSDHYLSDNSAYWGIAAGNPWAPQGTPDTDFLVQFPPGTTIPAGGLLTIEMGTEFETTYATCPDLTMRAGVSCGGNPVPQMVAPPNGGIGAMIGSLLSNGGEMVMLFCYSGGDLVYDVDYMTWDPDADPNTHVDKSTVPGYQLDTPMAAQSFAPLPMMVGESIGRCSSAETGENATAGNGVLGHDETSESFEVNFAILTPPSPGVENVCN